jgi:hypothetical protein
MTNRHHDMTQLLGIVPRDDRRSNAATVMSSPFRFRARSPGGPGGAVPFDFLGGKDEMGARPQESMHTFGAQPLERHDLLISMHCVTLRRRMNPRGFFCHSSVGDALRNGAWLRLGAHRNGGGIAETTHPSMPAVSWAVPCPLVVPRLAQRDEWPTASAFGILGTANTRAFRRCSLRNVPTRAEAFPELFLDDAALPKAGAHQMSSYLRSVSRACYIWNNTGVFLPVALRYGTQRNAIEFSRSYEYILTEEQGSKRCLGATL